MADLASKFWTKSLSNGQSLIVTQDMGLSQLSVVLVSGAGTVKGSAVVLGDDSDLLSLPVGISISFSAPDRYLLDGIEIASSGVMIVMGRQ